MTRRLQVKVEGLSEAVQKISAYDTKSTNRIIDVVKKGTRKIASEARRRVPVKTGKLKKTIDTKMYIDRGIAGYVRVKAAYGHLVEFGTREHMIKPPRGKVMKIGNDSFVATTVKHPGSRPNPFLTPAYEQEIPKISAEVKQVLKEVSK